MPEESRAAVAKRQREFRARKKAQGLKEKLGVYVPITQTQDAMPRQPVTRNASFPRAPNAPAQNGPRRPSVTRNDITGGTLPRI